VGWDCWDGCRGRGDEGKKGIGIGNWGYDGGLREEHGREMSRWPESGERSAYREQTQANSADKFANGNCRRWHCECGGNYVWLKLEWLAWSPIGDVAVDR